MLLPVLVVSYAILMLLVLVIATSLTRPLNRLTQAVSRVADGEYDLDLSRVVPSRFPDEMYTLAEAFSVMAVRVAQREANLTNEVRRLKVEIDHARREEAVREIVDSDFFADLTAKAEQMRRRMRGEDDTGATADPNMTQPRPEGGM
jgi:nitrogen fixation/metabolism regulation signal transduction histidine kinase